MFFLFFFAVFNSNTTMKKLFFYLLVCITACCFSACSEDDEDVVTLTKEQVVGKWNVYWMQKDGKDTEIRDGSVFINLKSDWTYRVTFFGNSYIGKWGIDDNTIIGTTLDPVTEYYKFTSFDGTNASIDYKNSDGERMKFKAKKVNDSGDNNGGTENKYFRYPLMDWGASKSDVKKFMSGYTLLDETSTSLSYYGKLKEYGTIYQFGSGGLKTSAVVINTLSIDADELMSIIKDRFIYVDKDEDSFTFISKDRKSIAVLKIEEYGYDLIYLLAFIRYDQSSDLQVEKLNPKINDCFKKINILSQQR